MINDNYIIFLFQAGLHCIAENTLSERLNEDMLRRPLDELVGKQVDIIRVYTVPTVCVRY